MLRLRMRHGVSCWGHFLALREGWEEWGHSPKVLVVFQSCFFSLSPQHEAPLVACAVDGGVRWEHGGDCMA